MIISKREARRMNKDERYTVGFYKYNGKKGHGLNQRRREGRVEISVRRRRKASLKVDVRLAIDKCISATLPSSF